MTPKEKADEIFIDMLSNTFDHHESNECRHTAKMCSLTAVDLRLDGNFLFTSIEYGESSVEYWEEVKNQIFLK